LLKTVILPKEDRPELFLKPLVNFFNLKLFSEKEDKDNLWRLLFDVGLNFFKKIKN